MRTDVSIPVTYAGKLPNPARDAHGRPLLVDGIIEATLIAFVGVGTSHEGTGSYSADVLGVAMLASGRLVVKPVADFTVDLAEAAGS